MTNMFANIFGGPTAQKAREARDTAYQTMLNTRRQNAVQQRTDDVKMARWNAMGNLLTTMVQPLGWAVGGKGTGVTGGVQRYDDRQYVSAFNRALKDADDIRNIGSADAEYKFKVANDDYSRALKLEDEERQHKIANEEYDRRKREEGIEYERRRKIMQEEAEKEEEARRERLEREYELKTELAKIQKAKGGKGSKDTRGNAGLNDNRENGGLNG